MTIVEGIRDNFFLDLTELRGWSMHTRNLLNKLHNYLVNHIYWETNSVADSLSKWGINDPASFIFISSTKDSVQMDEEKLEPP